LGRDGAPAGTTEKKCKNCKYWRPHVFYEGIGVCTYKWPWKMTFEDDSCEHFEPIKIDKPGFYWCATCRTRVTPEDYMYHLAKGHRLYPMPYVEPEVKEELYSVE